MSGYADKGKKIRITEVRLYIWKANNRESWLVIVMLQSCSAHYRNNNVQFSLVSYKQWLPLIIQRTRKLIMISALEDNKCVI